MKEQQEMPLPQRREELRGIAEEWYSWLCSYTPEAGTWLLRMLASMPGGEEMGDFLGETVEEVDWKRWELIEELCSVVREADDVRFFCEMLIQMMEEEQ
jgi:hypothetical protein